MIRAIDESIKDLLGLQTKNFQVYEVLVTDAVCTSLSGTSPAKLPQGFGSHALLPGS